MSLRSTAVAGVKWMSVSAAVTVLVGLVQTLVLSRLLEPRDFGLMAMVWVVLGFAQTFADAGVSNAIVQRQQASLEQLSSVYWLNVGGGFAVAALALCSVPLLVFFFREPALARLVPLVAVTFVIAAFGQPFQMVAQRDFHFGRLANAEIVSGVAAASVSISSAFLGAGVYSLVLGGWAASSAKTLWLVSAGWRHWRPGLHFSRRHLHGFVRFGLYQMGERAANYLWSNADYLMIGRFLGAGPLGIYRLAYETVVRPLGTLNPILNTVAYPVFAKKQTDDGALRRGFLEMIRLIGGVVFPMMAGLAVVAPLAVTVIFGEKWHATGPIIQILCILGALRSLLNPVGNLLLAKGQVDKGFRWNVALAVLNTVAFGVVAAQGVRAVAWAAVATMSAIAIASWRSFYGETIGLQAREYLAAISKPTAFSLLMAGGVRVCYAWLDDVVAARSVLLGSLIVVGAVTYAGLYAAFDRNYLQKLWQMLVSRQELIPRQVGEPIGCLQSEPSTRSA